MDRFSSTGLGTMPLNFANTRCQWDTSSKPSNALASVRILFVRRMMLSCSPFWNLARQGAYASPLRKGEQRVGMATRINHYSMIKWGSRRRSDGFTMGFLSFGRSREGKRNASYSIFTFWYWLPSGYVVTKVVGFPWLNSYCWINSFSTSFFIFT